MTSLTFLKDLDNDLYESRVVCSSSTIIILQLILETKFICFTIDLFFSIQNQKNCCEIFLYLISLKIY